MLERNRNILYLIIFLLVSTLFFFLLARNLLSENSIPSANELGNFLVLKVQPADLPALSARIAKFPADWKVRLITREAEGEELLEEEGARPIFIRISGKKGSAGTLGTQKTMGAQNTLGTQKIIGTPLIQPRIAETVSALATPVYYSDHDPLRDAVIPSPSQTAEKYLTQFSDLLPDYFRSDGNPKTVTLPESEYDFLDSFLLPSLTVIRRLQENGKVIEEKTPNRKAELARKKISERGIYITGSTALGGAFFAQLRQRAKARGINTLVIDMKGFLQKPFLEAARKKTLLSISSAEASPWLSETVQTLHREGFRVTGRFVIFKDDHLALVRPDLAVQRAGGGVWQDRKGGRWTDPYSDEVHHFNNLICLAAARSGVDEIQFDYIRFPTDGDMKSMRYPHQDGRSHVKAIMDFLRLVRTTVAPYNTSLALDIFGVTAWQSKVDIVHLGQDLRQLSYYLDVISPMLYPSHFHAGYDGYKNPGSEPYYFMFKGVQKAVEILKGLDVVIVPWIQGFNLRSPNYGPSYIAQQIRASKDAGSGLFLIWNARNVYDIPLSGVR